jgi:hypothetical protein
MSDGGRGRPAVPIGELMTRKAAVDHGAARRSNKNAWLRGLDCTLWWDTETR